MTAKRRFNEQSYGYEDFPSKWMAQSDTLLGNVPIKPLGKWGASVTCGLCNGSGIVSIIPVHRDCCSTLGGCVGPPYCPKYVERNCPYCTGGQVSFDIWYITFYNRFHVPEDMTISSVEDTVTKINKIMQTEGFPLRQRRRQGMRLNPSLTTIQICHGDWGNNFQNAEMEMMLWMRSHGLEFRLEDLAARSISHNYTMESDYPDPLRMEKAKRWQLQS